MRQAGLLIVTLASSLPAMAFAGALPAPMPGGGVAGPIALLAGIAVVAGVTHFRNRRK